MAGPRERKKLQPRRPEARTNILNMETPTRGRQTEDWTATGHHGWNSRDFSRYSSVLDEGTRYRGSEGDSSLREFVTMRDPNTNRKMTESIIYQGPDLISNRFTYPTGYWKDEATGEEGQLKGPQTWGYDPAIEEQGSRLDIYDSNDDDITMESIMKDMEEDAILYPEGSTPGGLEDYFFENKGDIVMHQPGDMRPPAFSGSVGTQIRPYDYNYNAGGIAGLPGQWTPSMSESEEEEYNIRPLQLDPGFMSIEDLEDLFEEVGLDKSIIYKLINTGGLSQLIS